jgi:hypothetical protein
MHAGSQIPRQSLVPALRGRTLTVRQEQLHSFKRHRLRKMLIETGLAGLFVVQAACEASHRHHKRAFHVGQVSQAARGLESIHLRHSQIEEHYLRANLRGKRDRFLAAMGRMDFVSEQFQEQAQLV